MKIPEVYEDEIKVINIGGNFNFIFFVKGKYWLLTFVSFLYKVKKRFSGGG